VNKNNIIKNLSKKSGLSLNISKKLIDDLIEIIINEIKYNKLNLKNFGRFKLIKKRKRLGRNPKTKEEFIINSRNAISFVVSKKLLNNINS
jgi:integration host factor subunit alpha